MGVRTVGSPGPRFLKTRMGDAGESSLLSHATVPAALSCPHPILKCGLSQTENTACRFMSLQEETELVCYPEKPVFEV